MFADPRGAAPASASNGRQHISRGDIHLAFSWQSLFGCRRLPPPRTGSNVSSLRRCVARSGGLCRIRPSPGSGAAGNAHGIVDRRDCAAQGVQRRRRSRGRQRRARPRRQGRLHRSGTYADLRRVAGAELPVRARAEDARHPPGEPRSRSSCWTPSIFQSRSSARSAAAWWRCRSISCSRNRNTPMCSPTAAPARSWCRRRSPSRSRRSSIDCPNCAP